MNPDRDKLNFLWFIDLDYEAGVRHGGNLRFFNYARELQTRGHAVSFAVRAKAGDEREKKRAFLESLRAENILTDCFEFAYEYPRSRSRLCSAILYPALANRVLREYQEPVFREVERFVKERAIDVCLLSDRHVLFLAPRLRSRSRVVIDWADSFVLYRWREAASLLRDKNFGKLPHTARYFVEAFAQESFYGKRCDANIVVSPIDKKVLDRINNRAARNHALLNGVALPDANALREVQKIPDRLIFTGNMNFPPNYEAALWFIENVLPKVCERNPRAQFVVAGANPVEELKRKARESEGRVVVTGFVEDMNLEIARSALYVAPLVSGGGFKNKVVEAMACGAHVVATPMAVEFLEENVRENMTVAETPDEMAARIIECFAQPENFVSRTESARRIVSREFAWSRRTDQLLEIVAGAQLRVNLARTEERVSCV